MNVRTSRPLRIGLLFLSLCVGLAGVQDAWADAPPTLTLEAGGHTGSVTALLPLPNEQLLTASFDNTIRLWDLRTGETLRVIRGQTGLGRRGQVNSLAMTPDGRFLVAAGWFDDLEQGNHVLRVYNWPAGTLHALLPGHQRPAKSLVMSPDGQFMASGDFGGVLRLWRRTENGFSPAASMQAHSQRVANIVFDPTGGDLLVSTGYDGFARWWRYGAAGLSEITSAKPLSVKSIYSTSFRVDGQVIAFGGGNDVVTPGATGEIRFYSRAGKPLGAPLAYPTSGVTSLTFSPDGRTLAVGFGAPGTDTRVHVYSHPENKLVRTFEAHDDTVNGMRFLPDGRTIVSVGSYNNAIFRWDSITGKASQPLGGRSRFSWNAGVSQDGQTLYWGTGLYDPKGLFDLQKANERGPVEWGLVLGAAGPDVVSAAGVKAIRGSSILGDKKLERFQDNKWQYVQLTTGGPKMDSKREKDSIYGATFLPYSDPAKIKAKLGVLVAGSESLGLFDGATGVRVRELIGHTGGVLAVAPSPLGDFAVTSGGDQTVRLWHLPTGELRLSVFQAGSDWIAWTPNGYYASSPQGDRLIGWQINKGEGNDPEHFSAAQFQKLLYRPDVVAKVLTSDGSPDPGPGVSEINTIRPPDVQVISPSAPGANLPVKLSAAALEVKALAKSLSKFPVTELNLLLDGRPYQGKLGLHTIDMPQLGEALASWQMELQPGEHLLSVQAKTAVSTAVSAGVPVRFVSSGGGGAGALELPNLYVLAIGISDYSGDLKLNYAADDATALAQTFADHGGTLRKVQTKVLTNQEATRENILDGFQWLERELTSRDTGVVYFSGHGLNDNQNNLYLLPIDGKSEKLVSTAVSGSDLRDRLQSMPGKVVAMLDACHSGGVGPTRKKAAIGGLTDKIVRELISEDCGVFVMCSSTKNEASLESNELKHGYFTLALTRGLAGEADINGDSVVGLKELDAFVNEEVKKLSGGVQHPVTKYPDNDVLPPPLTMPKTKRIATASLFPRGR